MNLKKLIRLPHLLLFIGMFFFYSCDDNLAIVSLVGSDIATAGDFIDLEQNIKNIGSEPTAVNSNNEPIWRTKSYLSIDKHISSDDIYFGHHDGEYLVPCEGTILEDNFQIPANTRTGKYYVITNVGNGVYETETHPIQINGSSNNGIDLVVTNVFMEDNTISGNTVGVCWTAHNFGIQPSSSSQASYYLSEVGTDFDINEAIHLGSSNIEALEGHETTEISKQVYLPSNMQANINYNIYIVIDSNNNNTEFNEENNIVRERIYVQRDLPDLDIYSFEAPIGVDAGSVINVKLRICNTGSDPANNFGLHYLLSTDKTPSIAQDIVLNEFTIGGMDEYQCNNYEHYIELPDNIADGIYYLFASIDLTHDIPEISNSNNSEFLPVCVHEDLDGLVAEEENNIHLHQEANNIQTVSLPVIKRDKEVSGQLLSNFIEEQLIVFPNPTIGATKLSFKLKKPTEVNITIRDFNGKVIQSFNGIYQKGQNIKALDLPTVPAGSYIVQARLQGKTFSKIVVVQ